MFRELAIVLLVLVLFFLGYTYLDSFTAPGSELTGLSVKESQEGNLLTGRAVTGETELVDEAQGGNLLTGEAVTQTEESTTRSAPSSAEATAEFDVSLTIVEP